MADVSARIRLMLADGAARKMTNRLRESPAAQPFELIIPADDSEAALLAAAPAADAMFVYQAQVPASVIRAAPALKLIQKHGLNCRNIDVAAATAQNVRVATMPLLRNVTVAEHALALMLACARKVVPGHQAVSGAVYQQMGLAPEATTQRNYSSNWPGIEGVSELFKATVGIVGMGDIGMEIAKRCRAFDMPIVYHQRTRAYPRRRTVAGHALSAAGGTAVGRRFCRAGDPAHAANRAPDRRAGAGAHETGGDADQRRPRRAGR